ncbi:MAG: hypothetical protein AB1640_04955 [bacterium]
MSSWSASWRATSSGPRPGSRNFLRFLVEETLAGRADEINGTQIAIAVFDRDARFDPQTDPIVRVQAGRLRRALESYYLEEGAQDPVHMEIPKGGYVPRFSARQSAQGRGGQDDRPLPGGEPKHPGIAFSSGPSIAVMPFTNMSPGKNQEFFADGLTEEIIVALSHFQDFRVFGRHSTLRYAERPPSPQEIGRDLGAHYILTGSVRRNMKTIRVSAQLLDSASGECLWTGTYDRDLAATNILRVQDDITKCVTSMIADSYGVVPRRLARESLGKRPTKLGTYEAVLHFHHYNKCIDQKSFLKARRELQCAVEVDPDYARAWAMLAELYCDDYAFEFTAASARLEKAFELAGKSVALDPMSQHARFAMAYVHFHRGEKALFIDQIEQAIALNPNAAYILGFSGWLMVLAGEWERGLFIMAEGESLNPYHPDWFHLAPYLHAYNQEDYARALAIANRINMPDLFWAPLLRASALGRLGRTEKARAALEEAVRLRPDLQTRCREIIGRLVKVEDLARRFHQGLQAAGVAG